MIRVRIKKWIGTIEHCLEDVDAERMELYRDIELPAMPTKGMQLHLSCGLEIVEDVAYHENGNMFHVQLKYEAIWVYPDNWGPYDPAVLRWAVDNGARKYLESGWKVGIGQRHWKPKDESPPG